MTVIKGPNGRTASVDENDRFHTQSIIETESLAATKKGNAYNINTGYMSFTSSTSSAALFFKNGENQDFHVQAIAVGVNSLGTTASETIVKVIRNPTTGTIIDSTPTNVDMNQNRSFSSTNTLADSLAYKGGEAETFTNGDDIAIIQMGAGSRLPRS